MKRVFFSIYLFLLISLLVIPLGIKPFLLALFGDQVVNMERELSRGTFHMVSEALNGLDPREQNRVLEQLQPQFGYPLRILPLADVHIDAADELDFLGGMIVWDSDTQSMVLRLGNSQRVLSMGGPFPGRALMFRLGLIFWGLCLICMILPALLWTLVLYWDIRKVEIGTARFSAGDHDARVQVSTLSSMAKIVTAVNTMADKTQKLIYFQKSFANAVSHEIRTPLARIKFGLEMMEEKTDFAGDIAKDVAEIEGLVDEMLTYARFERDYSATEDLPVQDMVPWLGALVAREEKTDPHKSLVFLEFPEGFYLPFEATYLGWSVRNLIRNGLRHAKSRVTVSLIREGEGALIHVDDDGPGIPEKMRSQVFTPFFRMDQSRSRHSGGGYGLGLAIARRIVRWHGGDVTVHGSPARGARFTLYLPPGKEIIPDLELPGAKKNQGAGL